MSLRDGKKGATPTRLIRIKQRKCVTSTEGSRNYERLISKSTLSKNPEQTFNAKDMKTKKADGYQVNYSESSVRIILGFRDSAWSLTLISYKDHNFCKIGNYFGQNFKQLKTIRCQIAKLFCQRSISRHIKAYGRDNWQSEQADAASRLKNCNKSG